MIRILRFKNLKYTRIFLHCKSMFFLIDINNIIIPITIRYKTSSNFRYYYFIVYYKIFLRTSTEYSHSRNTTIPVFRVVSWLTDSLLWSTGKMRHLVVVRRICCCSQFMIFPLQLLGQAIGFLADPSSSKGKNHELRTTTNSSN